jgi:hypothetical protein
VRDPKAVFAERLKTDLDEIAAGRVVGWNPNAGKAYARASYSLYESAPEIVAVLEAAAAIFNPLRGDAPWLHTLEFGDLRAALAALDRKVSA